MKNTTRLAKKNYKRVGKGGGRVEMGRNGKEFYARRMRKKEEWESDRTKWSGFNVLGVINLFWYNDKTGGTGTAT